MSILASGSSGNSIYLRSSNTSLLIDAGLSGGEITSRLEAVGVDPSSLEAVVVTHEHTDHLSGAGIVSRRYGFPLLITPRTYRAGLRKLGKVSQPVYYTSGNAFRVRDLTLEPFTVPHDAVDPVGLVVSDGCVRVGIVTDLGYVTNLVREKLRGCNCLVLESNHDPELLRVGPYPWELKRRVGGRHGHLSNNESASLLSELVHDGLQLVILAHISQKNNRYELADLTARNVLEKTGYPVDLVVARQERVSPMFHINAKTTGDEL